MTEFSAETSSYQMGFGNPAQEVAEPHFIQIVTEKTEISTFFYLELIQLNL